MNRHVLWSAIEAVCGGGLSLLGSFAIARVIGPAELGIGAAAVSVHVLLWVAVNGLLADALVQRTTVDGAALAGALAVARGIALGACGVQAAAGWFLAWWLGDARLEAMGLLLALPFPLVGRGGVAQGMLTRGRAYRHLAERTILGQGLGTLVGVAMALSGWGAWALAAQQAVASGAGALILILRAGPMPRPRWHWPSVRPLLAAGLPLGASTIVQIGRYRLFAVLIGMTAGPAALGQVHIAFRLVDTVRELLFTAQWRLMLPTLAEHQHDRAALLAAVDRLLARSSLVAIPLCAAMALALPWGVPLLMGRVWAEAGVAAEPLVALTALMALMFPSGVALVAAGQARFTLYANIAGLLATAAGVLLIRPDDPWPAVLVWCGAQIFVTPYALWVNARALGVGPGRPLRAGLRMLGLGLAGVMAIAWAAHPG